jgi:hypothetical protein
MNNTTVTPTSLAKQLVIEFMEQNQNKNRSVPKKEIEEYVRKNWNGSEESLTTGVLAGTLYDLSQANKLKNVERGYYVLVENSIDSIMELKTVTRQILSNTIHEIQNKLDSLNLEQLSEDDYPYITQVNDLISELVRLKGKFIFPPNIK